jgi:hypothetical protein
MGTGGKVAGSCSYLPPSSAEVNVWSFTSIAPPVLFYLVHHIPAEKLLKLLFFHLSMKIAKLISM